MKKKIFIVFLIIIYFANCAFFTISQKSLNGAYSDEEAEEIKFYSSIRSSNNDTTAPNITFFIPNANNTTISTNYYEFVVKIADANPPVPGDVSIEISNSTTSLFNASMNLFEGDLWSFFWGNLTFYPNEETYIVRVRAKDSSLNENYGLSNKIYVILDMNFRSNPNPLTAIVYFLIVGGIFALLAYFLNKSRGKVKKVKKVKE